jgi:hypothetical protein
MFIMEMRGSIEIAAACEKIWPFLTEPEKIIKWCFPGEKLICTSEGHSGLGATFCFEERVAGRIVKLNLVVTEWIVNKMVAFKMTSGSFIKGLEQKCTLESVPSGSRFTCDVDVKLPYGILGKAAGLMRSRSSEGFLETMLGRLKILAEA